MKKLLLLLFILPLAFSCQKKQEVVKRETKKEYSNIKVVHLEKAILAEGKLFRIDSFPTRNIVPRPVDIWLPENYSSAKKYAVLYMHDGQNLFDATTTWNKQEWMVDEVASKLMNENITKDFIVVGIHNIPKIRWQDLFPEKAIDYLNEKVKDSLFSDSKSKNFNLEFKGDEYLTFIVEELKPFIDSNYSTNPNQENTFVAGSSMGGLMSMYAMTEYPQIFGAAACLSTHWVGGMPSKTNPLPKAIFDYVAENTPSAENHKIYFDYGDKTLDQYYPQYAAKVDSIYKSKGYSDENFKNLYFEGTDHSELSWQKRLDIPLTFLLKK